MLNAFCGCRLSRRPRPHGGRRLLRSFDLLLPVLRSVDDELMPNPGLASVCTARGPVDLSGGAGLAASNREWVQRLIICTRVFWR